jgi:hypothetical protein
MAGPSAAAAGVAAHTGVVHRSSRPPLTGCSSAAAAVVGVSPATAADMLPVALAEVPPATAAMGALPPSRHKAATGEVCTKHLILIWNVVRELCTVPIQEICGGC